MNTQTKFGAEGKTPRGFDRVLFEDDYGQACSLQESSMVNVIYEDGTSRDPLGWLWLGINGPKPQILKQVAQRMGMQIPPGEVTGWMPYPLPEDVQITTRMHLNERQVRGLVDWLQNWLDTGRLINK